jgi:hypothetical protein
MPDVHQGGCLCGAVRYTVEGEPLRAHVCHCTYCQRRTGSAFAMVAVFDEKKVSISGPPLNSYEYRSDESGRRLWFQFCPRCATTVGFRIERAPTAYAISVGTFDDPEWFRINRHIWTRSAQDWVAIPQGTERFEKHFV